MPVKSKEVLGEIVAILMVIVLLYNLALIIYLAIKTLAEYGGSGQESHKYVKCDTALKSDDPFSEKSEENKDEEKRVMMAEENQRTAFESDLKDKVAYFTKEIDKSI